MYKKTILTTLIFCIPLAFLEQKKPEVSSLIMKRSINTIDLVNTKQSQPITSFSSSAKNSVEINSVEINSCWEKGDLASQKKYCSSSLKNIKDF